MTIVQIFALTMPPKPFFERTFARETDAQDYIDFWQRIGQCHVRRIVK